MLKSIWRRLAYGGNAPDYNRKKRTEWLATYLGARKVISLDRSGMGELTRSGYTRKQIFQSIYDLVIAQRAQMSADRNGTVALLSLEAAESQVDKLSAPNVEWEVALKEEEPMADSGDSMQESMEIWWEKEFFAADGSDNAAENTDDPSAMPMRRRDPWSPKQP